MYKRIIVKIGTSVITKDGRLEGAAVEQLCGQISDLRARDVEIIVVTSGAVATGRELLGETDGNESAQRQIYAAVGQIKLMALYAGIFERLGHRCAQILVT